jgi:glycosyltransferase involved in cell wall biosynthesis
MGAPVESPPKPGTIMFLLAGGRDKASSRVRGFWIAEALESFGYSTIIIVADSRGALAKAAAAIPQVDAVVFQKVFSRWHLMLLRLATLLGRKTVVDLDDWPARTNDPRTLGVTSSMISRASCVTVGGRTLEAYARQHQESVVHVPSSIRTASYQPSPRRLKGGPVTIGWIGNGAHYRDDLLQVLAPPLRKVAAGRPIRLSLVGACGEAELRSGLGSLPGVEAVIVDDLDWHEEGAAASAIAGFDVGVYPLLDSTFNRFKCGFKALEYMAMGVPVVASPVGSNTEIISHDREGFLASGEGDWIACLDRLRDATLRARMGREGADKVAREYTTEKAARSYAALLSSEPDLASL